MIFIKSAVYEKDYPEISLPEVAIAGRSNSGKSTLINTLASSKIAKASSTPGKTRLLNFFNVGNKYTLVDMPGYGFAARSNHEMEDWQKMIENYLMLRPNLAGVVLLMDIRRNWAKEEILLKEFLDTLGCPLVLGLTKSDKISRSEKLSLVQKMKKVSGVSDIFPISSLKKEGHQEIEEFVYQNWIKEDGQ